MPGDFVEVVRSGDRRASLEALRDVIAAEIATGVPPKDLASLSLRLQQIIADLGDASTGGRSMPDALAARRQAKESAAG